MNVYNVALEVVELVAAETPEAALAKFRRNVERAGYVVNDDRIPEVRESDVDDGMVLL